MNIAPTKTLPSDSGPASLSPEPVGVKPDPKPQRVVELTPLKQEKRTHIPTREMARHLGISERTLHQWNHFGSYPACLRPVKGRKLLMWPVAGALEYLGEVA